MNNCPHLRRIGDNYGTSCQDCGEQLSGYGYGGFFGRNLTGNEKCIHLFSPIGDAGGAEICVYCETIKEPCPHCRGTGADPMSDIVNWLPCPACKGSRIKAV